MDGEKLSKIIDIKIMAGKRGLNKEIKGGYIGDLLSDVMANAPEGCVWLTVQAHQNIAAVALLKDMACIIVTGGNMPDEDTLVRADEENIPVFTSKDTSFELSLKLARIDGFL